MNDKEDENNIDGHVSDIDNDNIKAGIIHKDAVTRIYSDIYGKIFAAGLVVVGIHVLCVPSSGPDVVSMVAELRRHHSRDILRCRDTNHQ